LDYITHLDIHKESHINKIKIYDNNDIFLEKKESNYVLSTKIDIHKMVKKMIKIFKSKIITSEKNIDFILELDASVPQFVKSSDEKINQILFNLLSNSLKITKVGFISLKITYEN